MSEHPSLTPPPFILPTFMTVPLGFQGSRVLNHQIVTQASAAVGSSPADVKEMDFDLVHVRFTFDRTRMTHMHSTLFSAAQEANFKLLPPDVTLTVPPSSCP